MKEIPFGQLQKLQDRIGVKRFRALLLQSDDAPPSKRRHTQQHGDSGESSDDDGDKPERIFKRSSNKHRPRELSAHMAPPPVRMVVPVAKKSARDPRFDDLSGQLNDDLFRKSYSFLKDVQQKEKTELQKKMRKAKDPERKEQLARLMQRVQNQEQEQADKLKRQKQKADRRKAEGAQVQQGKKPFFLKKSDEKKLRLLDSYQRLKSTGGLEKKLKSKRQHNVVAARKHLPTAGRREAEDA